MYQSSLVILLVVSSIGAIDLSRKCEIDNTLKFPDPKNHRNYITCKNGFLMMQKCAENEIFDSKMSECVPLIAESNDRNGLRTAYLNALESSEIIRDVADVSDDEFKCPTNERRNYPYPGDCRKYYYCNNGNASLEICLQFLLFDVKTSECQLFIITTCSDSFTTTTSTTTTTTQKPETTTALCPPNLEEDIPYGDCSHYYHCFYGLIEVKKCWWFQSFDKNKHKCIFFLWADC